MLRQIDNLLNRITMYRLVLYYLMSLVIAGVALSFLGFLPFQPLDLIVTVSVLVAVCWIANSALAKVFHVPTNTESFYITALILALIIPPQSPSRYFAAGSALVVWAGLWAMASKYILAIRRKHIFNPAAFGAALAAFALNRAASWWVGSSVMMPFVLVGGLLLVRKLARFDLVLAYVAAAGAVTLAGELGRGGGVLPAAGRFFADTPILFFGFVMLTEPLTTPPTRGARIAYGAIVGVLFAPSLHFGRLYLSPELALLLGNVFAYLVSPKTRYLLRLKTTTQLVPGVYEFRFAADRPLRFRPGQFLEWTLQHPQPDRRGNRRYFTIASSAGEQDVRLGVKFYPEPSSFKTALLAMRPGDRIVASQLAGEFVLPRDKQAKLVFVAGGIGITPFRSMVRDLLDRDERRPITVLYANRTAAEIVYEDVLDEADERLGIRTHYTLTDVDLIPTGWKGGTGRIDAKMIARAVPDYRERTFYLSGPRSLVVGFQDVLRKIGIPKSRIKTDFFPGFA
jgi:ferredoxin-NADP reductase/Na+-translocating ferredoxin:NAD+ oxidoreductase RnfD subunit